MVERTKETAVDAYLIVDLWNGSSFSPATGSRFSILPPDNAAGTL
jgi:hypothetical protein